MFPQESQQVDHSERWVQCDCTANTKGKGSEDGRFIGTNILNEAFLERFAITVEQPYPTASVEKIVMGSMKKYGEVDEEFATNLVTWAEGDP